MTTQPVSREQIARKLLDQWAASLARFLNEQTPDSQTTLFETQLDKVLTVWQGLLQARFPEQSVPVPTALDAATHITPQLLEDLVAQIAVKEAQIEILRRIVLLEHIQALEFVQARVDALWIAKFMLDMEAAELTQIVMQLRDAANMPIDNNDELKKLRLRCLELAEELQTAKLNRK